MLKQARLAFGQAPATLPVELEPRDRESLLRVTGTRMSRASAAVGGAALTAGRGIQAAGRAAGKATRVIRPKGGPDDELERGEADDETNVESAGATDGAAVDRPSGDAFSERDDAAS